MHKIVKEGDQYSFDHLIEIVELLRGPNGCPWDQEQNHDSIKDAVIEEAYELKEAINNKDFENIKEELGDLLLQVIFHSQLAKEENRFDLNDVIDTVVEKLIRRHPHVFEQEEAWIDMEKDTQSRITTKKVLDNWDEIKLREKDITNVTQDLQQVPLALPALIRSMKVQKKAAKAGFDFPKWEDAYDKVEEEIEELKVAVQNENKYHIEEEFGDLLFSMVNISRFLTINPENALTKATEKFINRFKGVETLAITRDMHFEEMSLEELDQLWDEVKKKAK